jgi:hypothetical protein
MVVLVRWEQKKNIYIYIYIYDTVGGKILNIYPIRYRLPPFLNTYDTVDFFFYSDFNHKYLLTKLVN